jgi:uncharacterized protein
MVKFEFQDMEFIDENDKVKVLFLKYFHFYIKKDDLEKIGSCKINTNSIEFDASEKKANRFNYLLEEGFKNLKNFKDKPAIYVHRNSGIPLIGTNYFGIIDRGTSLIEIKPVTGCNLQCIYCSVDEDKREREFVIEEEYLFQELKKVIEIKQSNNIEIHIGCQGEPLLYGPLNELVKDIKTIKKVKKISIDTNALLLNKENVNELIKSGITKFNVSINSLDLKNSEKIAGAKYPLKKIMETSEYIAEKGKLLIAPVWIPKINDQDMEDLIKYSKKLDSVIGIQKFLAYKFGRNIAKSILWDEFNGKLSDLEKKFNAKLILSKEDFSIKKDKSLKKPFRKGEIIKAKIICDGRFRNEKLAVSEGRVISILNTKKEDVGDIVKLKISRSKHNIFVGVLV